MKTAPSVVLTTLGRSTYRKEYASHLRLLRPRWAPFWPAARSEVEFDVSLADELMIIKRNRGRQWLDWQRRMVTSAHYVGAGACILLLLALCFGEMGLPRYFSMRDHAKQLEVDIQELERTTKALRGDINRLEHDPARIEQLARERLGYVRKGETVYQVTPDPKQERPKP